jgi:hypothetical protein
MIFAKWRPPTAGLGNAMKTRVVSILLVIAAVLGAGTSAAQQAGTVARLKNLEGNVLVSQGDAMVAATNDQRVPVGTRVLTMTGGKVVINYDSGCDISLKENQRFTVRVGECPALLSEVVNLGPALAAGAGSQVVIGVLGGAAFGYGVYELFRNKPVSPN